MKGSKVGIKDEHFVSYLPAKWSKGNGQRYKMIGNLIKRSTLYVFDLVTTGLTLFA